ncbi:hypothetical protein BJX68DRAFT_269408 [Aspergillus pseudodeflectus]|uniref:Uncharacterized protein n=1 Tax=Aspergillus pseudodeflectus TaxID=176178 RepID=A0ABR4K136_9EURO
MSGDKLQVYDESNNSFKGVEWCTVVGCVKQWDLKLVPSIPRDAAILPTMLRLFTQTAFICIGALYQMHKRRRAANRKQPKRCKGLRNFNVLDWLVHGWDLASLVWWWMTFSQFIVAPDRATAPFVLGWVTPWKYYTLFAAHPYCCVFRKSPRTVKAFRLVFYLLAAAQWCSMCYVVYLIMPREYYNYGTRDPYPSYDCDASRIAESPGMTTCSADQICNITNLFVDARFTHGTPLLDPGMSSMLLLGVLTAGAVLPVLRPVREVIIREIIKETQPSAWREKEKRILSRFQGMTLLIDGFMAATTFFGCMVGVFTVREVVTMYGHQADTMFAIDWECQAVHVFLSPWRYYLDIGYQRGLRIAQMWFNS